MQNPLSQFLGPTPDQGQAYPQQNASPVVNQAMLGSLANMVKMLEGSGNGNKALQMLAGTNPQVKSIMDMCSGKNPRDVFIQECQNRGVNPQYALNVLAQIGIR